jgi:hypothetical protein
MNTTFVHHPKIPMAGDILFQHLLHTHTEWAVSFSVCHACGNGKANTFDEVTGKKGKNRKRGANVRALPSQSLHDALLALHSEGKISPKIITLASKVMLLFSSEVKHP